MTFSTHAEANAAYRSTEAVLNNRFIKVFWHNPEVGHFFLVNPLCSAVSFWRQCKSGISLGCLLFGNFGKLGKAFGSLYTK